MNDTNDKYEWNTKHKSIEKIVEDVENDRLEHPLDFADVAKKVERERGRGRKKGGKGFKKNDRMDKQ